MSTFTIDPDNNTTALVEVPADADRSTTFSTGVRRQPPKTPKKKSRS
jgi:hypothetical protein